MFRNVGMIEVINEPTAGHPTLVSAFYPTAYSKIRDIENSLGVPPKDYLHIQFMDAAWGAGDAKQILGNQSFINYDHHHYLRWSPEIAPNHAAYLQASSNVDVGGDGNTPKMVAEWSLSSLAVAENSSEFEVKSGKNSDFYSQWYSAQVSSYEKQDGWIFWSWKTEMDGDYRWSYKDAVEAGIIPKGMKGVISANKTSSNGGRPSSVASLIHVEEMLISVPLLVSIIMILSM